MTTGQAQGGDRPKPRENAVLDCGWGRLVFGQTFETAETLLECLRAEDPGRRDIAFYVQDPHVLVGLAPQEVFLDPSHTYRLDLAAYRPSRAKPKGFLIRRLVSEDDAQQVNRIYAAHGMVPVRPDFFWSRRDSRSLTYLVAEDTATGAVIGTVTGVNHATAFGDPEAGTSLWCLAVDPTARHARIGECLIRRLAEQMRDRDARYLDLSVLHDNDAAIALYEKIGFERAPVFTLKRKNPINEHLFTGPSEEEEGFNPYAKLILTEARRRGIGVEPIDPEGGLFRLTHGGRSILCRESLTELTSAVALSICDDKRMTRRIVERAGIAVPRQVNAGDRDAVTALLAEAGSVVVKPARGEQGRGVAVGLTDVAAVDRAVVEAGRVSDAVLVEECVDGTDLRIVVIDYKVVAAALRRPAMVIGDGQTPISGLIERQSRRRAQATGGESRIPLDAETERCVVAAGYTLEDVLPVDTPLAVRRTANLHTGGTLHDVTEHLHPALVSAAITVARAIKIPVTGVDFMVPSPTEATYWFIEANERPGLANHEPQPTAERFIDLLFPQSLPQAMQAAWQRGPDALVAEDRP